MAVWADIDRKSAEQAGQHAAGARPDEIAIDVGQLTCGEEEASMSSAAGHHDDEADHDRQRDEGVDLRMIDGQDRRTRQPGRNVAEHRHAEFLQAENRNRCGRRHEGDQGAGHARAPFLAAERGRGDKPSASASS